MTLRSCRSAGSHGHNETAGLVALKTSPRSAAAFNLARFIARPAEAGSSPTTWRAGLGGSYRAPLSVAYSAAAATLETSQHRCVELPGRGRARDRAKRPPRRG